MEPDRFKVIIETYGSRESGWPDNEREAARQLIAESDEAHQLLASAQQLDRLLDNAAPPVIDTGAITRRIMRQVGQVSPQEGTG
ncbi:MAG: hypothetical protein O3B72_07640, partial [Proteobacteria bacterium]|nr:hypothetical protein [Pseudomonadota bacterium]